MKFKYTALSNDNQKLTGVLEAESLEVAQAQLHKINLSIISIDQISDKEFIEQKQREVKKKQKEGIKTFTFIASDNFNKEITGSIDAVDEYSAYKRLLLEYHFKVSGLYSVPATEEEKEGFPKKQAEWNAILREEGYEDFKETAYVKGELEDEGTKVDKEVVKEIDQFIINTKKVLAEHKEQFSVPFLNQIEKTLTELEHIRVSNNIKHISEICNQLYELISHPDRVPMEIVEQDPDAVYQGILNSMKNSNFVRRKSIISHKTVTPLKKGVVAKIIKTLAAKRKAQEDAAGKKTFRKLNFAEKITNIFRRKNKPDNRETVSVIEIVRKFFSYLWSPNAILRKTRKQELIKTWRAWSRERLELKKEKNKEVLSSYETPSFLLELNNFLGWLLFFYLIYFFLVDFSIEKEVGLSREFVIKTLSTPLIVNITIFLLFAHLILKIKTTYFKNNLPGSIFLFFCGLSLYAILIVNY